MTLTYPSAAAAPGPGAPAETQLVYDGRTGELFGLWFKMLLLNLITLGIYRFWGHTRIRRYIWSHVSLLGDRFEYDGTGGELFRRFLLALFIVVPLVLAAEFSIYLVRLPIAITFIVLVVLLITYLFLIAPYTGFRYRISRTLWRGIRGGLDGSATIYALKTLGYVLLGIVTLGLNTPWREVALYRYRTSNAGFGDINFTTAGRGSALFGAFLISIAIYIGASIVIIVAALIVGGIGGGLLAVMTGAAQHGTVGQGTTAVLGGFAIIFIAGIYVALLLSSLFAYSYYGCSALKFLTNGTTFGNVGLSARLDIWDFFRFQLGNALVLLITAGFGTPFVAHRYVRLMCRHLHVIGAAELEALSQAPGRRRPRGGEGLVQLFDTGGFA